VQRHDFVLRLFERAAMNCGHAFRIDASSATVTALSRTPTRQLIRCIDAAIGFAATHGRRRVLDADFGSAIRICAAASGERRARIGFI
jgi:hypothetical protein